MYIMLWEQMFVYGLGEVALSGRRSKVVRPNGKNDLEENVYACARGSSK